MDSMNSKQNILTIRLFVLLLPDPHRNNLVVGNKLNGGGCYEQQKQEKN